MSLKGNEHDGSLSDTDAIGETKYLLEKYARNMGLSFETAIGMILAVSKGQKSLQVLWF